MSKCGTQPSTSELYSDILTPDFLNRHHLCTSPGPVLFHSPRTPVAVQLENSFRRLEEEDILFESCNKPVSQSDITPTCITYPYDVMAGKVVCETYSGYPHENAEKFLSQFESYAKFLNLNDPTQDARKVAAFHLHLRGPANSWFNTLQIKSWKRIVEDFKNRYFLSNGNNPNLFLEMENFSNLKLAEGQPIEDFHSTVMEKGTMLGKPDYEVIAKFISGLPDKLRMFVGASTPADLMTALTQAKLGEASGWREHDHTHVIAAAQTQRRDGQDNSLLHDLKQQVEHLTQIVGQCMPTSQPKQTQPQGHGGARSKSCHKCKGDGHIKAQCNWDGQEERAPSVQCQVCGQYGHIALRCQRYQAMSHQYVPQSYPVMNNPTSLPFNTSVPPPNMCMNNPSPQPGNVYAPRGNRGLSGDKM